MWHLSWLSFNFVASSVVCVYVVLSERCSV